MHHLIVADVPYLLCFSHVDGLKDGCSILNLTFGTTAKGEKLEG